MNLSASLQRILVILELTFKEAVRKRFMIFLLICCILFIGTGALGTHGCSRMESSQAGAWRKQMITRIKASNKPQLEQEQEIRKVDAQIEASKKKMGKQLKTMMVTVDFWMIGFWLFMIAGLFTPFLAMNDFAARTHVLLLARPVARWEYLAGKFLAIVAMLLANLLVLLICAHGLMLLVLQAAPGWELMRGVVYYGHGLLVFTAMLICLSLLVGRVPAIITSVLIVGLGIVPTFYLASGSLGEQTGAVAIVLHVLAYGFPQFALNFFHALSQTAEAGTGSFFKTGNNSGMYALLINSGWLILFSALSIWILRNKELET